MIFCTLIRVASLTFGERFITRETVRLEVPAMAATSLMVGGLLLLITFNSWVHGALEFQRRVRPQIP
jgi:hypothetical protein